jgi:hypothetical protein
MQRIIPIGFIFLCDLGALGGEKILGTDSSYLKNPAFAV